MSDSMGEGNWPKEIPQGFKPSFIIVEYEELQNCSGSVGSYTRIELQAKHEELEWRATFPILTGEHWEPKIERVLTEAMNRYQIEVLDFRE